MKPTAKQVAHIAGVSLSAVSRAFTPGAPLDEAKRKRILAVAEQLGYQGPASRTAAIVGANTVTLVSGNLLNPFYPLILETLARQLQESGRHLLVYALASGANVDTITAQILAARPSAVIVTSANLTSNMARACRQHQIKVVLLNRRQIDFRINAVTCDNYQGGRDVGRLLLDRGYRRNAFLGGIPDTSTHVDRLRGFRDVLADAGLAIHSEWSGDFSYQSGYAAGISLASASSRPEAVFCCNDIMALGVIDAARKCGLTLPDDLAVVGFDDIPQADWEPYRLTTVRQPVERMVQEALSLIDDPSIKASDNGLTRLLTGELILRQSA